MGTTASTIALVLASVGLNPIDDAATDQVDLVEINHYHDEQGRLVFDQIIFYDWSSEQSRYQVRAFRMLKSAIQVPKRNWQDGGFEATWHDGQNGDVLRRVHAKAFRESWTQYDPELMEREFLPKDRRRELKKITPSSTSQLVRQRTSNRPGQVVSNESSARE